MGFGFSEIDKGSKPKVAKEDLSHFVFIKSILNRIGIRVGNEKYAPLYTSLTTDYILEVAQGNIVGAVYVEKYGTILDADISGNEHSVFLYTCPVDTVALLIGVTGTIGSVIGTDKVKCGTFFLKLAGVEYLRQAVNASISKLEDNLEGLVISAGETVELILHVEKNNTQTTGRLRLIEMAV